MNSPSSDPNRDLRELLASVEFDRERTMCVEQGRCLPEFIFTMDVPNLSNYLRGLSTRFLDRSEPAAGYHKLSLRLQEEFRKFARAEITEVGGTQLSFYRQRPDSEWGFLVRLLEASELIVEKASASQKFLNNPYYECGLATLSTAIIDEICTEQIYRYDLKVERALKSVFMPFAQKLWGAVEAGQLRIEHGFVVLPLLENLIDNEYRPVVNPEGLFTPRIPDVRYRKVCSQLLDKIINYITSSEYNNGWALAAAWVVRLVKERKDSNENVNQNLATLRTCFAAHQARGESEYYQCFDRDYVQIEF